MEIPKESQVKLIAYELKGRESVWWGQFKANRRRDDKEKIRTWPKIRCYLRKHFLPLDHDKVSYQCYQHCQPKNKSVHEYTAEFNHLDTLNNLNETKGQVEARYVGDFK